jgi:septal ring factor EnvC (AmiA/AmiB activator)
MEAGPARLSNIFRTVCRLGMILALDRPPGRAVVAAGLLAFNAGPLALAQTAVPDPLKQRTQELEALRNEQKKAAETTERLQREVEAIGEDRRKLSASLIETAGRVLAALQRMGRRPPPAIVVRPEDALEAVRSAILLGAVVPDMRNEAASIATDLSDLVHLRADITAEREKLAGDLAALSQERLRMAALIAERQKRQAEVGTALDAERQRASQLGRQIDNLKDLINKLEQGPEARPARPVAPPSDTGARPAGPSGLGPAIAFASAKGLLPLPVNGVKSKGFGAPDGLGGTEKGISIATRPGAQVTAPCDGWVVYAAPYRSYGQLLILNAGGGYHVLVAGMDRISVDVGQFVLTGEPVAVMGNGAPTASVAAVGAGPPALYVEFRKDGVPVDPTPWWAINDNEKVRG